MHTRRTVSMAAAVSLIASAATGGILDFKSLAIDFTDADDAAGKATWSEPDRLSVTTNGLGWSGEAASSRDGWLQTIPMALGLSWRPPYAVSVRVSIHPKPAEFVLNSGQRSTPYAGDVYVRYSPDWQHWSTWQVLQAGGPPSHAENQPPGRNFSGNLRVPYSEREPYARMVSEYARLEVPWKSDEDAAVRWMLEKEPDFFARQLPFIGYVQFRYEAGFYGGQRLTSFKADVSYGMSGMHAVPKDRDAYKDRDSSPWSFKARPIEQEQKIREKMKRIIIPEIEFRQANIQDVMDYLHYASGVDFILHLGARTTSPPPAVADPFAADPFAAPSKRPQTTEMPLITFSARDISLHDAINIICKICGLRWSVQNSVVMIEQIEESEGFQPTPPRDK